MVLIHDASNKVQQLHPATLGDHQQCRAAQHADLHP